MQNLTEQQRYTLQDLQTQERLCVEKYAKYANEARDAQLKDLFTTIKDEEQKHLDSITQVLSGSVPQVNLSDNKAKSYAPTPTYVGSFSPEDKAQDTFLCTDSIATEKYVSSAYNSDLFKFADSDIRELLADIEIEEQQHAEMIYKYKTVNQMV